MTDALTAAAEYDADREHFRRLRFRSFFAFVDDLVRTVARRHPRVVAVDTSGAAPVVTFAPSLGAVVGTVAQR